MSVTPTLDWCAVKSGEPITQGSGVGVNSVPELVTALEHHLRNTYPINEVPPALLVELGELSAHGKHFTNRLLQFSENMIVACGQVPKRPVFVHMGYGPHDKIKGSMCSMDGMVSKNMDEVTCPDCRTIMFDTSHRG